MANQNFRVKNGINVGTAVTITTDELQIGDTIIHTSGIEAKNVTITGTSGISTISSLNLTGSLYDVNNNVGTGTSVLISTGIGVSWIDIPTAALQGVQGTQGTQGTQGLEGVQGTQGIQGVQGTQGIQGTTGTQGIQGITGTQGATGSQGTTGAQGATGSQGTTGAQGATGSQGTTGAQGATGSQGTTGAQGATGSQGTTGTQGAGGLTTTDATTLNGISAVNLFNNMGGAHSTRTSFDATTPSYGFGHRFVQGSTNGPGTGGSQFYSWYTGLGSEYPATGGGSYGAMFAVDRNTTTPFLSVRYNEANSFTSWYRINSGNGARAWVNFNGTNGAIRGSFNVSSVSRNSIGNYTVNFSTAMVDANYNVVTSSRQDVDSNENAYSIRVARNGTYSTTAVQLVHGYYVSPSNVYADCLFGLASIFR